MDVSDKGTMMKTMKKNICSSDYVGTILASDLENIIVKGRNRLKDQRLKNVAGIGMFIVYGSWNGPIDDNEYRNRTNINSLSDKLLEPYVTIPRDDVDDDMYFYCANGFIQADANDDELEIFFGEDKKRIIFPCPPDTLPAIIVVSVSEPSMTAMATATATTTGTTTAEVLYLSSMTSNDIMSYLRSSSSKKEQQQARGVGGKGEHDRQHEHNHGENILKSIVSKSVQQEVSKILHSFGIIESKNRTGAQRKQNQQQQTMSSAMDDDDDDKGEAIRIFVAGDRMSVGKTSVCLGLLGSLVEKGYPSSSLAYIKPATQNEKPQLVQRYCERVGISCIPIGPIVYYRGFTRAFLADETESSEELLHKVSTVVDELAYGKRVVIIDGVGFPAVGSICGTDNASVAKASGYPRRRHHHHHHQQQQQGDETDRHPLGVLMVGGSGVGSAVDAFNLNSTYFEKAHIPVMGAIFNKLSTEDGFYSLSNCKQQVSLYFEKNMHQIAHQRQAFGFIPIVDTILQQQKSKQNQKINDNNEEEEADMYKRMDDFIRTFQEHVDIDGIINAARNVKDGNYPVPMDVSSGTDRPEEAEQQPRSQGKRISSSSPIKKRRKVVPVLSSNSQQPQHQHQQLLRSREEIERAAISSGAAPSA